MTIESHNLVGAGARHAIHNLEYADRADREAGTSEGSGIVLSSANVGQVARQASDGSYWVLSDDSPIIWEQIILRNGTIDIQEGGILKKQIEPIELADGEYHNMPSTSYGCGTFLAVRVFSSTAPEIIEAHWDYNAVVTSIFLSANAAITNTAGKFCAYDAGSNLRILNNLGYSIYMLYDIDGRAGPVA